MPLKGSTLLCYYIVKEKFLTPFPSSYHPSFSLQNSFHLPFEIKVNKRMKKVPSKVSIVHKHKPPRDSNFSNLLFLSSYCPSTSHQYSGPKSQFDGIFLPSLNTMSSQGTSRERLILNYISKTFINDLGLTPSL